MACTIDFRNLDEGFGGKTYKRKRSEQAEELLRTIQAQADDAAGMDVDGESATALPPPSKRQAVTSADNPDKPIYGAPTYDGVIAGKVSGRKWKEVRSHRSSAMKVSRKKSTFEERAKEKEIKRAYKERMTELKEEIRQNKVMKRKQKEEAEKRKKENILRTGTKIQVISNPKTIKKISKSKQRKQLKVVPDALLSSNNKKKSSSSIIPQSPI